MPQTHERWATAAEARAFAAGVEKVNDSALTVRQVYRDQHPDTPYVVLMEDADAEKPDDPASGLSPIIVATFQAEAWQHDHAIPVDAHGETEWEPGHIPATLRAAVLAANGDPVVDRADVLKMDHATPEWARLWMGPFTITLRTVPAESDVLETIFR